MATTVFGSTGLAAMDGSFWGCPRAKVFSNPTGTFGSHERAGLLTELRDTRELEEEPEGIRSGALTAWAAAMDGTPDKPSGCACRSPAGGNSPPIFAPGSDH